METREETLGKLYALRAGLSYIAQEVAPIYQEEGDLRPYELVDFSNEKLRKNLTLGQRKKYEELMQIKRKSEEKTAIKKEIETKEKDLTTHSKEKNASKALFVVGMIFGVLLGLIALASAGVVVAFVIMWFTGDTLFWQSLVGVGAGVVGVLLFGGAAALLINKLLESDYIENKDLIKYVKSSIEEGKEKIVECETAEKELAKIREEREQKRRKLAEHKREVAKRTRPIYYALKESTESFISERDWENLDLVIYYFDTGRADTIKEALQLVDRQKQTDMIVNAIRQASSEITTMIVTATRAVISAVDVACEQICSRLDSIDSNIGKLNASIDANTAATASLVSATQLQNALMAQANRTSAQLASDVSYLKGEYALMRRM